MRKPILCLDFDGVLHSYSSGWQGAGAIPDPPVAGAVEFMRAALDHFRVAIYSSRSATDEGVGAMQEWLFRHSDRALVDAIEWPRTKPPAYITLDDRAVTFSGAWPSVRDLLDFCPWHSASNVNKGARLVNSGAFAYADLERRHLAAVQLLLDIGARASLEEQLRIEAVVSDTRAKHAIRIESSDGGWVLRPITPPAQDQ